MGQTAKKTNRLIKKCGNPIPDGLPETVEDAIYSRYGSLEALCLATGLPMSFVSKVTTRGSKWFVGIICEAADRLDVVPERLLKDLASCDECDLRMLNYSLDYPAFENLLKIERDYFRKLDLLCNALGIGLGTFREIYKNHDISSFSTKSGAK